jgi:hypothetical protein
MRTIVRIATFATLAINVWIIGSIMSPAGHGIRNPTFILVLTMLSSTTIVASLVVRQPPTPTRIRLSVLLAAAAITLTVYGLLLLRH